MKLKLSVSQDGPAEDLDVLVSFDASTSTGEVAAFLASSQTGPTPARSLTLAIGEREGRQVNPVVPLAEAGIPSGTRVRVVPASGSPHLGPDGTAAATVVVVAGPDQGREYPVSEGLSYIGRGRDCEVRLTDPMTSRRHARLSVGETVEIADAGSVNGVLLADVPTDRAVLGPGDVARLGDTVLAVRFYRKSAGTGSGSGAVRFIRSPLVDRQAYEGTSRTLPQVPAAPRTQRFPILPLFAPLLMGAALYLTTRSTTSLIFMAMSPLMMVGNVAEGQMAGKRTFRRDLAAFESGVQAQHAEATAAAVIEAAARCLELPSGADCSRAIRGYEPLLWCRRPDLPGFGLLRLGLGAQASRNRVEFPIGRQGDAELLQRLHEQFDVFASVSGVPVVAELDASALGVTGLDDLGRAAARSYVVQLAALHSPGELVVVALCSPQRAAGWEWLKWLPQCAASASTLKSDPLASSRPDTIQLLGELEGLIRARYEQGGREAHLPRIVVLLDGPLESERSRLVELAERGPGAGVWVLWVADDRSQLPAACKAVVEVDPTGVAGRVGYADGAAPVRIHDIDGLAPTSAEELARLMAPMVDVAARDDEQSDVPPSVSFLDLVGAELATDPTRVVERWAENRSLPTVQPGPGSRSRPGNLRAVIGESATGPHVLDLRVHGPHALVGGTTGAGKSELLQSWIIGMALSNSPQRLTFLLVDYKGGSAFSDCVGLPHTVGLVTDLSPHLVRRALTSLSAELRYREEILHRKRAKDLAALERDGDPDAPPSLVIVVDEFAALVNEVPEFVDGVVNVAQRGRSLGLHLILATQRPSGVIRDNLRANTNLRIALRMADVADSSDVIGSKAAAGFDPTLPGRAASRTGPTALVPFQTAYVGGWSSTRKRSTISVETFGFAPRTVIEPLVDDTALETVDGPTDIQRLVTTMVAATQAAGVAKPRKPWLDTLASRYELTRLPSRRRDDELVFAVADDPGRQAQATIAFRPDVDGNMAVFGTGNAGKSTLLRTLAVAAGTTARGGPCHVYALDFAARGLQMIEQLPHVGAVIAGTDTERVGRLLALLRETIERRAARFASVGAGSLVQYRQIAGRPDEARLLLLVDGMGGMRTAFEGTEHHRLFEAFLAVAGDGRQVGVHVVIAADRAGAVPSALNALVQRRVVLRLANDNDYAMLSQPNDVLDPKSPPGRGLCDGYEIQVAVLGGDPDVLAQDLATREISVSMRTAGVAEAPAVRRLEELIELDNLAVEVSGRPTFAVASASLEPVAFEVSGTFNVVGPPGSGRTTTLLTLAAGLQRWCVDARLIYFGSKRSSLAAFGWERAALDIGDAATLAPTVADLLGDAGDGAPPGLVVIENLVDFVQSAADGPLQDMVKRVVASGHLVVSDGEPLALSGLQPLVQAARASRVGIALQPDQSDGMVFRAQLPKARKADFPPGRGFYLARGQQPSIVQVALAGSLPR